MEGFLNQGWGPIVPGCGGTGEVVPRGNSRGAYLEP